MLASALLGAPSFAQPRTVRVDAPACASLPFAHEQLVALLEVELRAQRITLVGAGETDAVVRYDAEVCGGSRLFLSITQRDQSTARVEVRAIGARDLALLVAELLRDPIPPRSPEIAASPRAAPEAPALGPAPSAPAAHAPRDRPFEGMLASAGLALTAPAPDERDEPETREVTEPRGDVARTLADVSPVSGALLVSFLYNPENRTWVLGPHLEVALRMPFLRELRVHVDASLGVGRSGWGIDLVTATSGAWIGAALGGPDLAFELGPRISLTWAWTASELPANVLLWEPGMVAVSGVARLVGRVYGGTSLLADVEVGGNVTLGVRLARPGTALVTGGGVHDPFFVLRAGAMLD